MLCMQLNVPRPAERSELMPVCTLGAVQLLPGSHLKPSQEKFAIFMSAEIEEMSFISATLNRKD